MATPAPKVVTLDDIRREEARRRLDRVNAEIMARSLRKFAAGSWHVVQPGVRFVDGWHLGAISEHLQAVADREIRRLLITMPPRHMKSILCSVMFPAYVWLSAASLEFLYASYALRLASRDSVATRDLILSDWYRERWGNLFDLKGDQNEKLRFDNTKGGTRLAVSTGGALGEGGDVLVIDDAHDGDDVHSDTIRKDTIRWHNETWTTRANDPKTSAFVTVGQRLHPDDLQGTLIARGGYVHLDLPTEFRGKACVTMFGGKTWRDPRTKPGELLWPERIDAEAVKEAKRDLGSWGFETQHQQNPTVVDGGMLKRTYWRFWFPAALAAPPAYTITTDKGAYTYEQRPLPEGLEQTISVDCTFKGKADSDFVAAGVWGGLRLKDGKVGADDYMLDNVLERLTFTATLDMLRKLTTKWPSAGRVLVEDKANGTAVMDTLSSEIGGLIAIEPKGGKIARAWAAQPRIEAGNVYLPHPAIAPWVADFITHCAGFPNIPNDDNVDQTTQYLADRHGKAEPEKPKAGVLFTV